MRSAFMAYAQRILVIFSFKIREDIQNVYIDVVHQYHTVYMCSIIYKVFKNTSDKMPYYILYGW